VLLADHYFDEAKKELISDPNKAPASVGLSSEWYGKALSFKGLLPMESQLLRVNRGQALELEKKYDEAMKEFESLATSQGDGKPLAMLSMGRIQELKGDKARALEIYEKVSQDFNNTEYGKVAKNHLRRLKGNLFQSRGSGNS